MQITTTLSLPVPSFRLLSFVAFAVLLCCSPAIAQKAKPDSLMTIPMISGNVGLFKPGADMGNRFGNVLEVGGSFTIKTKSNWMFGLDAHYLYSERVKEDVLAGLRTNQGGIFGGDGLYADVRTTMRGFKLPVVKAGRLFSMPFGRAGVNSGLFVMAGVGLMQHKIHFEDVTRNAPMVAEPYSKGYDRLTNGLIITEQIGYLYLDKNRRINFFVSMEFTQGFTESRRSYDFVTRTTDTKKRLDLLNGVKVGWIFPIYKKLPSNYYYQ
ncbi:MAG: hypothetical protein EOP51_27430 [Sphingobacteriales bacterium]|nr:MAG: hypothetical protein EOP51_27430 [Sphingobacteriales bacterium]